MRMRVQLRRVLRRMRTRRMWGPAMSERKGLPYGWWKSKDFWLTVLGGLVPLVMFAFVIAAWFLDWSEF